MRPDRVRAYGYFRCMREVGRNDACPCGSGRKHKRCCLNAGAAALRLAARVEDRVVELGLHARRHAGSAWQSEFERSIGPVNEFGVGPADDVAWLDLWAVCHAPLLDGRTPLDAASDPSPVDDHLRASAICGWWARGDAFPLAASHWRFDEPLTLHSPHDAFGGLEEGSLVVARGVGAGGGHLALVGRPVVVDDEAVGDVLALLTAAPDSALCAALRWPEERTYTADGELVQHCFRRYELANPAAAVALLRAAPGIAENEDVITYWPDDVQFEVDGPAITEIVHPPQEPGVLWELCREDAAHPPLLGEVIVSFEEGELAVNAPTAHRTDGLLAALPAALRNRLGEPTSDHLDMPSVLPRVRRDRVESFLRPFREAAR